MNLPDPLQAGLDKARNLPTEYERADQLIAFAERCIRYCSFVLIGMTADEIQDEALQTYVASGIATPTFGKSLALLRRLDRKLARLRGQHAIDWERTNLPRCAEFAATLGWWRPPDGRSFNLSDALRLLPEFRNEKGHNRMSHGDQSTSAGGLGDAVIESIGCLAPLSWPLFHVKGVRLLPESLQIHLESLRSGKSDERIENYSRDCYVYEGACFVDPGTESPSVPVWPFLHAVKRDENLALLLLDQVSMESATYIDAAVGGRWMPGEGAPRTAMLGGRLSFVAEFLEKRKDALDRSLTRAQSEGGGREALERALLAGDVFSSTRDASVLADLLSAPAVAESGAPLPVDEGRDRAGGATQGRRATAVDGREILKALRDCIRRKFNAAPEQVSIDLESLDLVIRVRSTFRTGEVWDNWALTISAREIPSGGHLWIGLRPNESIDFLTPFQARLPSALDGPDLSPLLPYGHGIEAWGTPSAEVIAKDGRSYIDEALKRMEAWYAPFVNKFELEWEAMKPWERMVCDGPARLKRSIDLQGVLWPEACRNPCFVLHLAQALWVEGDKASQIQRREKFRHAEAWFRRLAELSPMTSHGRWGTAKSIHLEAPRRAAELAASLVAETIGALATDLLEWAGLVSGEEDLMHSTDYLGRLAMNQRGASPRSGEQPEEAEHVPARMQFVHGLVETGRSSEALSLLKSWLRREGSDFDQESIDWLCYLAWERGDFATLRGLKERRFWQYRRPMPTLAMLNKAEKNRGDPSASSKGLGLRRPAPPESKMRVAQLRTRIDRAIIKIA